MEHYISLGIQSVSAFWFCLHIISLNLLQINIVISGPSLIKLIQKLERKVGNFWFKVESLTMNQFSFFKKTTQEMKSTHTSEKEKNTTSP